MPLQHRQFVSQETQSVPTTVDSGEHLFMCLERVVYGMGDKLCGMGVVFGG